MSDFLSFRLPEEFKASYEDRQVPWGLSIGGGNSLSELVFLAKYSRRKEDGSKETWAEVCARCIEGMYSILKDHAKHQRTPWNEFKAQRAAQDAFERMFTFKWTPPGRGMWAMGTSFVHENQSNSSLNNCSFISTEKLSTHSAYEATMPFSRLMEQSMCIAEGSWVLTAEGPQLIEDVEGPQDVIVDGEKHHAPLGAWRTGVKPVISLETTDGYSLRLTRDHQVQRVSYRRTTGNVVVPEYEWVEAGSLVPGDKVRMNSHADAVWNGPGTFDEGYLVGAVLGDGWKEANSFVVAAYYNDSAASGIRKQCEVSVAHVPRRSHAGGWRPKNNDCEVLTVGTWVKDYLTFEPKATTDSIESTSKDFHVGFLRGLFDADGGVTDAGSKGRTVRLTQSNLDTLKRAQRMLHRLGIKSSISVKRSEQKAHEIMGKATVSNPSWTLSISRDAVLVFREVVGFSEGPKRDLLQSWTEDQFYHSYPDATVKSIDDLGVCDVYDMTVPEVHAFDANGFYVHNCGVGVGFDTRGAGKLTIWEPEGEPVIFEIPDTREGWSESISVLLESYFFKNRQPVEFDYSKIRPAGSPLRAFGGTASGPEPLMWVHESIQKQFAGRHGEKITSRDIVDIMNKLGKAVVAGGARRSALIALGDPDDADYIDLKNWELPENAERTGPDGWAWTSNNSVVVNSGTSLDHLVDRIAINGEPGVVWLDLLRNYGRLVDAPDHKDYRVLGVNPCVTADTWVMTATGPRQVEELIDLPHTAVVNGKEYHATGFWKTGEKEVYRVSFVDGRELRLTDNHQLLTDAGEWVELKDLAVGDRIKLNDHGDYSWGGAGTFDEGYVLGHLIGDGTFSPDGMAYLAVWGEDEGSDEVADYLEAVVGGWSHRSDWKGWFPSSNQRRLGTASLRDLAGKYGVARGNKTVTPELERASSEMTAGVLSGLFDTDGSVQGTHMKGISVRLSSTDREMLAAAQRMLLRLGINSTVYTRRGWHTEVLPDGRGGHAEYECKPQWELVISKRNLAVFAQRVGFRNLRKQQRLVDALGTYKRALNADSFSSEIVSIDFDGVESVYDVTVDDVHAFDANGLMAHNCAEISLESHEFCCLVELYPSRHETFDDFKKSIKHAYMYAKAVTLMPSTWAETNEVITRNRRIGVSMTGIVEFVESRGWDEMQTWMDDGYKYLDSVDTKYSEWLGVRDSIKITTVKPAGTTSLIAGTTAGVHWPTTTGWFLRRLRFHKTDPILEQIEAAGYDIEPDVNDPSSTVVATFPVRGLDVRSEREVSIWEKAHLAAMAQRYWADNMVSVTVSFKEEERKEIAPLLRSLEGQLKTVSFLPIDESGTSYAQAPFEPVDESTALAMMEKVSPLDVKAIYAKGAEAEGERFCTTDTCELPGS